MFVVLSAFIFQAIILPPPKIPSTPGGPPTTPRIKLRDGRYLVYKEYGVPQEIAKYKAIFIHSFDDSNYEALLITSATSTPLKTPRIKLRDGGYLVYKEYGVPKEIAKYKAIFIHSFDSSKYEAALITSPMLLEDLGVYLVSFDRPGYGESDPHSNCSVKGIALDIEELADQLGLGSKFYVIGYSMGGVALLAPGINYWWPGLPANLTKEVFTQQLPWDQLALEVAHYYPWLVYWWNSQTLFPRLSIIDGKYNWSQQDLEIYSKIDQEQLHEAYAVQQGVYESLDRDIIIWCQNWEFDPIDLKNPFPNAEGHVHLWQGVQDGQVSVTLQRYIVEKLPWIKYHELQDFGHLFPYADGFKDSFRGLTNIVGPDDDSVHNVAIGLMLLDDSVAILNMFSRFVDDVWEEQHKRLQKEKEVRKLEEKKRPEREVLRKSMHVSPRPAESSTEVLLEELKGVFGVF
ncbi:hypothetical protein HAX54_042706 [Datura stramonium]|uniref:AB hydrolase-1 domain-containing protein n=1 Tax=Datura stramonium TaxID=4076 RepID=A0ABS8SMM0_DATST|nr:hypothetical protein [Datura stramonium]